MSDCVCVCPVSDHDACDGSSDGRIQGIYTEIGNTNIILERAPYLIDQLMMKAATSVGASPAVSIIRKQKTHTNE